MIPTICYGVFCFGLGLACRGWALRWRLEWEHDRGFCEGRKSERADARRERSGGAAPFVMLTTGDGSRETPFTREMHYAQCAAFHGRRCDCDLLIGGLRR